MTKYQLLQYAYDGALLLWNKERDFLNENPNNDIAKLWEQRRWKDLEEIKNMLLEMEKEIEKC